MREGCVTLDILKIDHIAIAVKNIDEAITLYKEKLCLKFECIEVLPERNVKVAFLSCGDVEIELVEPLSTGTSAVGEFIKEKGEGIYHLAFKVNNIKDTITKLQTQGLQFKGKPPSQGANNSQIAFLEPTCTFGTIMEFVEK